MNRMKQEKENVFYEKKWKNKKGRFGFKVSTTTREDKIDFIIGLIGVAIIIIIIYAVFQFFGH